ncbi:hypothetical protein ACVWZM_003033 [Bradyrhizobium sp. USDA 4501]
MAAPSPDKCLSCGTRVRPKCPIRWLDAPDGSFHDLPYWFCSEECYKKIISPLIKEQRYGFDKLPYDDPEWEAIVQHRSAEYENKTQGWVGLGIIARHFNPITKMTSDEYVKQFTDAFYYQFRDQAATQLNEAEDRLYSRLLAEYEYQLEQDQLKRAKDDEKERIAREKEEDKERIAREKEEARLEQERLAAQAEEEKLRERDIPVKIRLEHTMVLAPSGAGKTTLLQNLVLSDYHIETKPTVQPAYIVIDPKGSMIKRLRYLRIFEDPRSIAVIDPKTKPALNLFTTQGRDPSQLISDFSYIFSTTKQKLTGKQAACFAFCARLLFNVPNANLETLLDLMDDRRSNPIFQKAVAALPPIPKRFFDNDYYEKNFASTREELKSRIYGIAQNDWLAAMFNARSRKLDIAQCIREKRLLLVNTRMTELSEDHQVIGRYIISLVQDAIQNRKERHPVYLVIDEAQEFMDAEKTPRLLRLMREYGGGVILAFQNMFCAELDEAIRAAISTNTSIKYAASPEAADLNYMARDLRCSPEFLKGIQKTDTHARFACYVRGMNLQHPFIATEELGWIDKWPRLTEGERKARRCINRTQFQDEQPKSQTQEASVKLEAPRANEKQELKQLRLMSGEDLERLRAEQSSTNDDNKPSPWESN